MVRDLFATALNFPVIFWAQKGGLWKTDTAVCDP